MPNFTITIQCTVEKTSGKFVSKDEIWDCIEGEMTEPTTLYVDESEYEVTAWELSYE